ncbi:hypothetical protein, partial [Rhizobium sp. Root483D2]|uniref:hypothetical protein n=1 Tax=Rhizobium sp. Root483D2 TaxID=1736545 RepID=UPI001AEC8E5D
KSCPRNQTQQARKTEMSADFLAFWGREVGGIESPGIAGAAVDDGRVLAGLTIRGIHVDPGMIRSLC